MAELFLKFEFFNLLSFKDEFEIPDTQKDTIQSQSLAHHPQCKEIETSRPMACQRCLASARP